MMFMLALYKGTRPGLPGIYNRLVRLWTRSQYSHCELVFSDGVAASSSFEDKGVRFKQIDFDSTRWDFILLPAGLESAARIWFENHIGQPYDLVGNIHFLAAPIVGLKDAWICSEAGAAALGIPDPWRYDPATLASTASVFLQPSSEGIFL